MGDYVDGVNVVCGRGGRRRGEVARTGAGVNRESVGRRGWGGTGFFLLVCRGFQVAARMRLDGEEKVEFISQLGCKKGSYQALIICRRTTNSLVHEGTAEQDKALLLRLGTLGRKRALLRKILD
jgi:hypothetical protein